MFGKKLRALVPIIVVCALLGCMFGVAAPCGAEEARFVTDYKAHWQIQPAVMSNEVKTSDTATFFVADRHHGQEAEIERLVKENKTLSAANANLRDEIKGLTAKLQGYAVAATVTAATAPATCDPNDPNCTAGGSCGNGTACGVGGCGTANACGNGTACGNGGNSGGFRSGWRPGILLRRVFGRRGGCG